jgi:DNA-directed RNA polymerase subunit RPC12/RpoP
MTDSTKPVNPTQPLYPEPQHFPEIIEMTDSGADEAYYTPSTPMPAFAAEEALPHVEHSYVPDQFACVRCGSKNLARGYVVDYGEQFQQVHFAPKRITISWLNSLLNLRPWKRLLKLDAVACRDCGAVLLEVNPAELRRAEVRRE